jgi:hypothetical protein
VIGAHLGSQRIERTFQAKQLFLADLDIEGDGNVLRFLAAEPLAQKSSPFLLHGWGLRRALFFTRLNRQT